MHLPLQAKASELNAGDRIWNATRQSHERIGRIVRVNADREEVIDAGRPGDIVAVLRMKQTLTGDTLCASADKETVLERLIIPEPVTSVAIETASREDHAKLGVGLNRLIREDPTLHISVNSESGQSVIAGTGELHLEMAREKLTKMTRRYSHLKLRDRAHFVKPSPPCRRSCALM